MISRRSMVDPIKLAKEHAQYMSSLHLSSLRNGGVVSPNSFQGESVRHNHLQLLQMHLHMIKQAIHNPSI
jgi:hypothetical protein